MNWYMKSVIAEKVQPSDSDFSWAFVSVPENIMEVHSLVTREIDKFDLYIEEGEKKGDWSYGIEDTPHITVKYGFEFDDPKSVIDCLKGEKGGSVEVNGIEIFEQDDYDVLVATVKSEALNRLHEKLTEELKVPDSYPEYKPHITIAYFKKGMAKEYEYMAHRSFIYYLLNFDFNEVTFEDTKDHQTKITLK